MGMGVYRDRMASMPRTNGPARSGDEHMSNEWNLIELGDLGVLRLYGPDAVRFLQGQVSIDVERLTADQSQLTGYHNPQGRVIALLRLVQLAPEDLLAILPRELAASVASRLGKFVLRAKVKIADESARWRVIGLVAPHASAGAVGSGAESHVPAGAPSSDAPASAARAASWAAKQFEEVAARAAAAGESTSAAAQLEDADSVVELPTASALMLPEEVNGQSRSDATVIVRVGAMPARWLIVSPTDQPLPLSSCAPGTRDAWRLLDIAEGLPTVYATTSEEFVAQMLNLDALGGISFDKGCYTGQEVIARAHYRGRVKRRLQRFVSRAPVRLATGQAGQLSDGRTFKLVEAASLSDGRCEFLAVTTTAVNAPSESDENAASVESTVLDAEVLPLPYPLPD